MDEQTNDEKNPNDQVSNHTSHDCDQYGAIHFAAPVICSSNKNQDPEIWILDSGSTVHVTNSHVGITNWAKAHETIIVGSGKEVKAYHKGTVTLRIGESTLTLKEVLYVPKFAQNIVSVSRLVQNGNTVEFDSNGSKIQSHLGHVLELENDPHNDMLYLCGEGVYPGESFNKDIVTEKPNDQAPRNLKDLDINYGHRQFGHLSEQALQATMIHHGFNPIGQLKFCKP